MIRFYSESGQDSLLKLMMKFCWWKWVSEFLGLHVVALHQTSKWVCYGHMWFNNFKRCIWPTAKTTLKTFKGADEEFANIMCILHTSQHICDVHLKNYIQFWFGVIKMVTCFCYSQITCRSVCNEKSQIFSKHYPSKCVVKCVTLLWSLFSVCCMWKACDIALNVSVFCVQ